MGVGLMYRTNELNFIEVKIVGNLPVVAAALGPSTILHLGGDPSPNRSPEVCTGYLQDVLKFLSKA